jgi:iron complex transport system permease protein
MNLKYSIGCQIVILSIFLCVGIIVSTGLGYIKIPATQVIKIMMGEILKITHGWPDTKEVGVLSAIVLDIRLPRILTAAVVGGGLAISGVIFQGILLNPLADPYTLGVSAGAAFGASVALLLNIVILGPYSITLFAFIGAVSTLVFVIFLSSNTGQGRSSTGLILSGIIVAAILSAGISMIKYLADEQVSVIVFWLMGSFSSKTWGDVFITALCVFTGFIVFLFYSRDLNLLALGNRSAFSLGVDTKKVQLILLITSSLVAAVCVSVSGIIGFVGLLVPHMMRTFTGPDNRRLLPVSLLTGAILLLCADTFTRAVLPVEIPIGVLTALIGGPFFCYVFRKHQTSMGKFY